MTNRSQRSAPRGAILIFVLLVLLLLTLGAAAYFQLASSNRATALAVTAQQMAATRAEQAAQQAIADVRNNGAMLGALTTRGTPNTLADCASNCVVHATMDGGSTLDLNAGGGLLWDYMIYRNSMGNPPTNRYNIIGTGYYGYTAGSPTYTEARVEVEIDVGIDSAAIDPGLGGEDGFIGKR